MGALERIFWAILSIATSIALVRLYIEFMTPAMGLTSLASFAII